MPKEMRKLYEFGPYRLNPAERLLMRDGLPVSLPPKAFEILVTLVSNSGHLVEKDTLMKAAWPDSFVEDGNIALNISILRKAFQKGGDEGYIETVSKYGYRFVPDVREISIGAPELMVEKITFDHTITEEEEIIEEESLKDRRSPRFGLRARALPRKTTVLVSIVVIIAGSVAGAYILSRRTADNSPTRTLKIRSLAVLPLDHFSSADEDKYLALGVADSMITRLSRINGLVIRPTNAVLHYTQPNRDPLAIGRELRVESVLDGRMQREGDRIKVTAQLLRVQDGVIIWAGAMDQKYSGTLDVEDAISERIYEALSSKMTEDERQRFNRPYTQDTEAYTAYLKGRYFWSKRSADGLAKAIIYYRQAIDRDPNYALAYAGLADAFTLISDFTPVPPADSLAQARTAAQKALQLDPDLAEAHAALGHIHIAFDWDWHRAEEEYLKAIELNPNYATARQWYAEYLMLMGRDAEAREHLRRAREIDPLSVIVQSMYAASFYYARDYDHAIEEARKAVELDPGSFWGRGYLSLAYEQKQMYGNAIDQILKSQSAAGVPADTVQEMKTVFDKAGWKAFWAKDLDRKNNLAKKQYVSSFLRATAAVRAEETDQAFSFLQQAVDERNRYLPYIKIDPQFDSLRSDARFARLLKYIHLSD